MTSIDNVLTPVHLEDIVTESGIALPSRKAVIRDDGQAVSVVSDRYNLVSNEEAFSAAAEAILNSGLNTEGMTVDSSEDVNLRRSLVNFIFPAHQVALGDDVTNLRLVARNSYDGSWKIETLAGAFRMACANGQVFGEYLNVFSSRHSRSANLSDQNDRVGTIIEAFNSEGEKWVTMSQKEVTRQKALNFLTKFHAVEHMTLNDLAEKGERNKMQLAMSTYDRYATEMGETMWAVYNTMTELATFNKNGESNIISMQQYREEQVRSVINSRTWTEAIAA